MRWRGIIMIVSMAGVLLAPAMPALAGQTQARFRAVLRIVDISAGQSAASQLPATARSKARSSATSAQPRRLPRADGSGWCVRIAIGNGRWRWKCS